MKTSVSFQDLFQNYRIYSGIFLIFKTFSLPVFEICIILRDTLEIKIYSTSVTIFLHFSGPTSDICIFYNSIMGDNTAILLFREKHSQLVVLLSVLVRTKWLKFGNKCHVLKSFCCPHRVFQNRMSFSKIM